MRKDKRLLYILSGLFTGSLLLCCFVPKTAVSNLLFALMTAVFAAFFGVLIGKRRSPSHNYRQVLLITLTAALMLIALHLLTGLGFGLHKTPWSGQYWYLRILPYTIAIVGAEYIRHILLAQETRFSSLAAYLSFILFDAALFRQDNDLSRFSSFWEFASMVFLPSLTANLLYAYVSKKYGYLPVIAYRIPLAVYPYLLPVAPNMPAAMLSFVRILLPLAVLFFLRALYGKRQNTAPKQHKLWHAIASVLGVLAMTAFIMLVSCRFQYGVLVIATDSMTGSQDKGCVFTYEQYGGQDLQPGQVIAFSSGGRQVVHRITRMQKINGVLQIYTKGDANETEDIGFITTDDIIGTEVLTIPYLGYPTLWLRELFTNQ